MHYGVAEALHERRVETPQLAYAAQPLRFEGHMPTPPALPTAASINPSNKEAITTETSNLCSLISNDQVSQSA